MMPERATAPGQDESMDISERYKNFSREELVEEYLTVRLAGLVNFIGTDWHYMPTDVSQDAAYWKKIDGDLHEMHKEIARRYGIERYDCLWLENMVDSTNLYVSKRRFRPIVEDAIRFLEKAEAEKDGVGGSEERQTS